MREAALVSMLIALPTVALAKEKDTPRPDPLTYGVGAGITAPSKRFTLNTASIRFRLGEHVAVEPTVVAQSGDSEFDGGEGTDRESSSTLAFGADLRFGFAERGPADGVVLVGVGLASSRQEDRPDGPENDTVVKSSSYYLEAGLGTEYWINRHISWSADGLLLSYISSNAELSRQGDAGRATTETTPPYRPTRGASPPSPRSG